MILELAVAGTSDSGILIPQPMRGQKTLCSVFSSLVHNVCFSDDISLESKGSGWEAIFGDFPEGDPYSSENECASSVAEGMDLLGEIGIYVEDISNLPFEERYSESK